MDHNERTQCVDGWEEAEILEIIDHHRIGNLETSGPVYFRNQPVGCTATVIYQMYQEADQDVPKDIAGLLLSAILSDTLKFQSPTCTPLDVRTAKNLADIAQVDMDELAQAMFEAGESLDGKTAEDIFQQDYKTFVQGSLQIGVGQGSFVSQANYDKANARFRLICKPPPWGWIWPFICSPPSRISRRWCSVPVPARWSW